MKLTARKGYPLLLLFSIDISRGYSFSIVRSHIHLPRDHGARRRRKSQLLNLQPVSQESDKNTSAVAKITAIARQQQRQQQQEQQQQLVPLENPHATPHLVSAAGREYGQVLARIDSLFPPCQLEHRNAVSRTAGYWPFVQAGERPPPQYTYGEFDFYFFAQLLDDTVSKYHYYYYCDGREGNNETEQKKDWSDKVFCDIGSGAGRLVLAAAALHPNFKVCRGIEILPSLHEHAQKKLISCRRGVGDDDKRGEIGAELDTARGEKVSAWQAALTKLIETAQESYDESDETAIVESDTAETTQPVGSETEDEEKQYEYVLPAPLAPDDSTSNERAAATVDETSLSLAATEFVCGSFLDPYVYLGDADCIFVFSSCMPTDLMDRLAQAIGRQCRPGTIVITTDRMLPLSGYCQPDEMDDRILSGSFALELMEQIDGYGWITGGASSAFVHRVKESLWSEGQGPLQPKELSLEDQAFQIVCALEKGELNDPKAFLRAVYNNMVFAGLPDRFLPNLDDVDNKDSGL